MSRFPNGVIYAIDADFAAAKAAMATMGTNVLEAQIFSGTSNILTRYNQLSGTQTGFAQLGSYTPSTSGGSFSISDANITTIVNGVKNHAQTSHIYYIFDEPNLHVGTWTTTEQNNCRSAIQDRRDLIHSLDTSPLTRVVGADFRQNQLDPVASGRAGGMWLGIIDEVILSSYPFPNAVAVPTHIPMVAGWCDDASMPYSGALSVHNFLDTKPAYPTVAQMQYAFDQWSATNSVDLWVYIWSDDWDAADTSSPNTQLRDDPTMQAELGAKFAETDIVGTITLSGTAVQSYTSSRSGSGSISLSGTAVKSYTSSRSGSGNITLSGTAVRAYTSAGTRSGTITLSGATAQAYTSTGSRSGTIIFSGSKVQAFTSTASRSGTIRFTGTGVEIYVPPSGTIYTDSASGTVTFTGSKVQAFTASVSSAGTISFTGTGVENYAPPGGSSYTDAASGTITFSGTATEVWGYIYTDSRSGTITFTGTGTHSCVFAVGREGTITLSGSRLESPTAPSGPVPETIGIIVGPMGVGTQLGLKWR